MGGCWSDTAGKAPGAPGSKAKIGAAAGASDDTMESPVAQPSASGRYDARVVDKSGRNIEDFWTMGRQIGTGAFSKVYLVTSTATAAGEKQKQMACKVINKAKLKMKSRNYKRVLARLVQEVEACTQLDHPAVIKISETFEDDTRIFLLMEMMGGGELFDFIINRGALTEREAAFIVRRIAGALTYMHGQGIAHRDMKPENLMLKQKNSIDEFKIIDFGMAKIFGAMDATRSRLGTPGYMAPEVIAGRPYGVGVDMWSLGVITYVLLVGYMPFDDSHGVDNNFATDYPDEDWALISPVCQTLIDSMLCVDPKERLTAADCLKHPWVAGTKAKGTPLKSPAKLKSRGNQNGNFAPTVPAPILENPPATFHGNNKAKAEDGAKAEVVPAATDATKVKDDETRAGTATPTSEVVAAAAESPAAADTSSSA